MLRMCRTTTPPMYASVITSTVVGDILSLWAIFRGNGCPEPPDRPVRHFPLPTCGGGGALLLAPESSLDSLLGGFGSCFHFIYIYH